MIKHELLDLKGLNQPWAQVVSLPGVVTRQREYGEGCMRRRWMEGSDKEANAKVSRRAGSSARET